jgi:hypothetical protein
MAGEERLEFFIILKESSIKRSLEEHESMDFIPQ